MFIQAFKNISLVTLYHKHLLWLQKKNRGGQLPHYLLRAEDLVSVHVCKQTATIVPTADMGHAQATLGTLLG